MQSCAIVPTRGRPSNAHRLANAFNETAAFSQLYFVVDNDDPLWTDYTRHEEVLNYRCISLENKTGGCAKSLNDAAVQLLDFCNYPAFDYFIFMGDDHLPKTKNWDQRLVEAIGLDQGIAYGDDLLQGENLPTAYAMSRELVVELQGMTFPGCKHLFFDNFVKQLGIDLKNLKYCPDVIIEHLHPVAGKAEVDEGYARVNQPKWYEEDLLTLQKFLRGTQYAELIHKFR